MGKRGAWNYGRVSVNIILSTRVLCSLSLYLYFSPAPEFQLLEAQWAPIGVPVELRETRFS